GVARRPNRLPGSVVEDDESARSHLRQEKLDVARHRVTVVVSVDVQEIDARDVEGRGYVRRTGAEQTTAIGESPMLDPCPGLLVKRVPIDGSGPFDEVEPPIVVVCLHCGSG